MLLGEQGMSWCRRRRDPLCLREVCYSRHSLSSYATRPIALLICEPIRPQQSVSRELYESRQPARLGSLARVRSIKDQQDRS